MWRAKHAAARLSAQRHLGSQHGRRRAGLFLIGRQSKLALRVEAGRGAGGDAQRGVEAALEAHPMPRHVAAQRHCDAL